MTAGEKRTIHPLAAVGLLLWVVGAGAAIHLWDWRWLAYGFLAFMALGIVGALLAQQRDGGAS